MGINHATEVVGEGTDTIFVTAIIDGGVALTAICGDTGRSVYLRMNAETVQHLRQALDEAHKAAR